MFFGSCPIVKELVMLSGQGGRMRKGVPLGSLKWVELARKRLQRVVEPFELSFEVGE